MTDPEREDLEKPKAGAGDVAHAIVRTGLSVIPIVGGTANEIFSSIITPPLAKRRDKWIESVVRKLEELEKTVKDFKLENLSKNEVFISAVTYATTIAIRNNQKEKLDALRNAVLNVALSSSADQDQIHMFLNYIDTFTEWHIRILMFFNDPRGWAKKHDIVFPQYAGGSASQVLEDAFPELREKQDFYVQIVKDLSDRGLMNNGRSLGVLSTTGEMLGSRTTRIGKRFIEFIEFST
jgi:hypothetical protein